MVTMGLLCFLYNRHQARLDTLAEEDKAAIMARLANNESSQKPVTPYAKSAYVRDEEDPSRSPEAEQDKAVTMASTVDSEADLQPVTSYTNPAFVNQEEETGRSLEDSPAKMAPAPTPPVAAAPAPAADAGDVVEVHSANVVDTKM